jgi:hypothetical protein
MMVVSHIEQLARPPWLPYMTPVKLCIVVNVRRLSSLDQIL